jgi:plasmid maintenance system antidote protein VapI
MKEKELRCHCGESGYFHCSELREKVEELRGVISLILETDALKSFAFEEGDDGRTIYDMCKSSLKFEPDWNPPHPGEHVEEYLLERGIPPEDYAGHLGLPQEEVDGLLRGTVDIDERLARHLSGVISTWTGEPSSPDLWLRLQARYDGNTGR